MDKRVANGVAELCFDGNVASDRHRGIGLAKSYTGGSGSRAGGARFWVLAFALLLLNGLGWFFSGRDVQAEEGRPDSVRLLRMEPLQNLEKASEINLIFDRSVVQDADVGVALTVSPFSFEPEVEGRWRWTAKSQLSFELQDPLPLGHKYRLVPHLDFSNLTGFAWAGDPTIDLQTQGLTLERSHLQSSEPGVMTIAFDFNQPVSSEDLAAALTMHGDNKELDDWSVLSKAPTDSHLVRLKFNTNLDIKRIGYVIDKELCGHGAEVPMLKDMRRVFFVPKGFTATSVYAYPSSTDNTCSITIRFNEYLSLGQENPELTFTPEVECTEPHVSGSTLRLTGEFLSGQTYTVQVGESLLSGNGGTLGKKVELQFKVRARSPRVAMPEGNGLLMPDGELRLGLRVTNIQNLVVSTTRLHANNLVSHLHNNSARETSQAKKTKLYELDLDANVVTESSLSLRDLIEEPLGVYRVSARSKDSYWNRASALVRVSDLALTVKREAGGLFVWVTSLSSGQPLQGVVLEARTQNNQILGAARSSEIGVAHIAYPEELPDGGAFVVSATLGRDFAYLQPGKGTWVFDKVDTAGKSYSKGLNAWLYTERGVYRPGETIHLTGLLRNPDGGFAEENNYEVRLQRPDGRVDWRGKLQGDASPDSQGLFQIDLPTRTMGPTGVHTVVLWDGKASEVRRKLKVNVEDFIPTRLEVGAVATVLEAEDPADVVPVEATSDRAPAGILLRATASGANATAAGGANLRAPTPAVPFNRKPRPKPRRVALQIDSKDFLSRASKGLAVRVLPHWKRLPFKSALLEGYSFTEPTKLAKRSFQGGRVISKLDDKGRATVQLSPSLDNPPGLWQLRAASTITEVGGRSVTHTTIAKLDTADHHLGFRLANGVAPVAEPMQIDWAIVTRDDKKGEPVPYKVRLEHVVHEYGMKQVNGRLTWQREVRHEDVERFQIGQDEASGALNFKVLESGSYRLLAEQVGGRGVAEFTFYAGNGAPTSAQTDPQLLELTLDSAAYEPGDMASLEVRGQFDGQLLITLESDRVLTSQVLDFKAPAANLQIQLPGNLRGGAFFSASLIRGIDPTQTSWLPHRARGLKRVKTTHMGHALPLALNAPKRVAPGETVTIHASSIEIPGETSGTIEANAPVIEEGQANVPPEIPARIQTGRPARLHVWAVDTGILLATGEKLPDPHAHFFAQHKSGVGTVDSWAHLLPDHMRADSVLRIGGDTYSEEAMARRLAALPPTRRSSGVAWSRAVDLGPDGTVDLDLKMPNIRGAVTLRAVLVDGDSYACSEQRIELATDLQITASWPRYTTSGDKLRVPVKLLNTTDAPMEARLETSTEGPVTFAPEHGYQPVQLAANEEVLVWFLAETPEPGTAQIELSAVRTAGVDTIQTEFQVRPATAFHQETRLAKVEAGSSMTFDPTANFESRGLRVNVAISGNPQIELRPALRALLDYPHGCLEQTTSRLYALVNAGALFEDESDLVESMVNAGILRLHAMQTRGGGLGYWMGNTSPSTWGSAYAGGFLAEAKRAGFDVPVSLSSPLVEFLSKRLRSGEEPLGTQALMCRVLAAFGKPQEGWMSRVQEQLSNLDLAGRAHLAAAWLQLGRRDRAMECLHEDTLSLVCRSSSNGRITSQIRQEGALLSVLLDLDPEHQWISALASRLHKARENGRWRSTLEDAAALSALARYQAIQDPAGSFTGALVTASGERFEFDSTQTARFQFADDELGSKPFTIETQGDAVAHVVVDVEGNPTIPVAAYDRNLAVRRKLFDADGNALTAQSEVRVGDLIQVEVTLSAPGTPIGTSLPNFAIVDTMPAGLEIENPRLATSATLPGQKSSSYDRVEFREDRVVIFASARPEKGVFRYSLRATLAGDYSVPPIQASSMYDPGYASLGGVHSLHVVQNDK